MSSETRTPASPTTAALKAGDASTAKADVLLIGVRTAAGKPEVVSAGELPKQAAAVLASAVAALDIDGGVEGFHRLPAVEGLAAASVALVGLGELPDLVGLAADSAENLRAEETLRRAAGAAVRQLAGVASVAIALPTPTTGAVAAVAEGALLGAYAYLAYRTGSAGKLPVAAITIHSPRAKEKASVAALERARIIAAAVHGTRDLVNQPPSDLYPASFAEEVKAQAKNHAVKVTVLDEKQLAKEGFGGIIGVGQGSIRPPRLVKVAYTPAKPKAHLALVGKGITFDSGGISLKPPAGMEEMKSDMAGAASVLQAVFAIADLGLPVRATAWLTIAENMPSGAAQRPSDVITIYGGKTVEVLNTDAEGRLVMADGIVAAGDEDPDLIIDVATLTGSQIVALGKRVSAVMGDDDVREQIVAASARAGELFWPMPLPEELRKSLDSSTADIANVGERAGSMLVAGVFLREFVGPKGGKAAREKNVPNAPKIPWGHLDVAGPAFNGGSPWGYTPKQGTGVPVRTLVALAENMAALKK